MTDYVVSANEARDLLDGYEALKSSPECSGACARAAAPDLARTVVALHERVAAVEAERDGALAQCEALTQALREAQRARDAAAQAFDDLVATVWRAATGDEHEPPTSTDALVESVRALRETQRERDAMKAIVEGRTTPPTVEEAEAHINAGRSFRVVSVNGGAYSAESVLAVDLAVSDFPGSRWWALDSHGRPCAWPEVPRG